VAPSLNEFDTPLPRWDQALASAKRGARYRIRHFVFVMVREHCREAGLAEGDEVKCLDNRGWAVHLERSDGHSLIIERDYAWFVEVEVVDDPSPGIDGPSPKADGRGPEEP
jgi:hypothetical protein